MLTLSFLALAVSRQELTILLVTCVAVGSLVLSAYYLDAMLRIPHAC